jgi:thiol:disulfide interchange protein
MRNALATLGAVCLLGFVLQAQPACSQTPPPTDTKEAAKQDSPPLAAQTVMNSAMKKAQKEKKAVMVIFHASWCGWCKRL